MRSRVRTPPGPPIFRQRAGKTLAIACCLGSLAISECPYFATDFLPQKPKLNGHARRVGFPCRRPESAQRRATFGARRAPLQLALVSHGQDERKLTRGVRHERQVYFRDWRSGEFAWKGAGGGFDWSVA